MKNILAFFLAILLILGLFGCQESPSTSGKFEVHIIDIGQGDSILLKTPEGKVSLIDTGAYKSYPQLKAYLLGQGINHFDKVIATHPDADHIGSMAELINDFPIDKFYLPKKEHTTKSFKLMMEALETQKVPIVYSYDGDEINMSKDVNGHFLSPKNQTYSENNLYSLVLYLKHENNSFLFMGDAETPSEIDILAEYPQLNADLIKLGHHGSSSSSSKTFIKTISPSIAIVSAGKDNSFGHPHKEVVSLLKKLGIPLYRTDEQGSLVFLSDGQKIYSNKNSAGSYKAGSH